MSPLGLNAPLQASTIGYYYAIRYYDLYIGQIRAVLRSIRRFPYKINRLKADLRVTFYP